MNKIFADFLSRIDGARTDEEAWQAICVSIEKLGFDRAIYLYYPDATSSTMGEPLFRTTYADDWMEFWNSEGYNEVDIPVRKTIEAGYGPMIMDVDQYIDSPDVEENSFALQALSDAKNEGGCGKVYSHQLFHGQIGLGAMGLISDKLNSQEFAETVDRHAPTLSSIIHIGHARLSNGLIEAASARVPYLSGRQRDMLVALSQGHQYKKIAHEYGLSENTVAFHIAELKKKLNCSNSREILAEAFRLGLLNKL